MSGGEFNYAYSRVNDFVEELRDTLDNINENYRHFHKEETLYKLVEISKIAEKTSKLMKEAEWFCSGDTSEESFLENVKAIESL